MASNRLILSRQDRPPTTGKILHLLRIDVGEECRLTILSRSIEGYLTHYYDRRTHPHANDRKLCKGCLAKQAIRWRGFIVVYNWQVSHSMLLEITEPPANKLQAIIDEGREIRGQTFMVRRVKKTIKSSLGFYFLQEERKEMPLPLPLPILPTLKRLWHFED